MKKFLKIPQRIEEDYHFIKDDIPVFSVYTTWDVRVRGMLILDEFPTEEIHATDDFKEYETVFMNVPQDYNASSAVPCLFINSIYVIPCLYIRSLSVMLSRISFHVLYGRSFKTLCLLNYALMKRHDYDIMVFFTKMGVTIM
nr:hypothetical protein [Tanacetum cinerariifolium]